MAKGTEAQLERAVIDMARLMGYMVHGVRPAFRQSGEFSDPLKGDRGFPDLILVGNRRIIYVELKSDKSYLAPEQKIWRDRLVAAGADYCVFRPRNWSAGKLEQLLRGAISASDLPQK